MFNLLYILRYHFSGDNILSNGKIILDTLGGSLLSFKRTSSHEKAPTFEHLFPFEHLFFKLKKGVFFK